MAVAEGTEVIGDAGVVASAPKKSEQISLMDRVTPILQEYVGKPVTSALVNELTDRVAQDVEVKSVVTEQVVHGIKMTVEADGTYLGTIGDHTAIFKSIKFPEYDV